MKVCVIQHKYSKEVFMSALRIILTAESYLGKNKARGMEGTLVGITRVLAVLFIVLAIVLNLRVI